MDELICSEHGAIEIDEVAVGVADPAVFNAHVDVASQTVGVDWEKFRFMMDNLEDSWLACPHCGRQVGLMPDDWTFRS